MVPEYVPGGRPPPEKKPEESAVASWLRAGSLHVTMMWAPGTRPPCMSETTPLMRTGCSWLGVIAPLARSVCMSGAGCGASGSVTAGVASVAACSAGDWAQAAPAASRSASVRAQSMAGRRDSRWTPDFKLERSPYHTGKGAAREARFDSLDCIEPAGGEREVCGAGGVGREPGCRRQQVEETSGHCGCSPP